MGSITENGQNRLKLLPAEDSDMQEILEMHLESFRSAQEPYIEVLYPRDEPLENAVKRTLSWWKGSPAATYMKVVDEETGKIISAAKWCVYREQLTEEQMNETLKVDWHMDPDDNAFCEHCISWLLQRRTQIIKGNPCVFLEILSTHSDHQHRGAGALHMKWGAELADSLGLKSYIEASAAGRSLYEKFGFVATPDEWVIIPVSEQWKSRPEIKCYWLERPAKKI